MDQKPGHKTTEFYLTLLGALLGLCLALGWITPDQQAGILAQADRIIGGILALASILGYTLGRSSVKKAETNARAMVEQADRYSRAPTQGDQP